MPELDARPMVTMADMGHGAMGGHDMSAMAQQKPADAGAATAGQPAAADPHAAHVDPVAGCEPCYVAANHWPVSFEYGE